MIHHIILLCIVILTSTSYAMEQLPDDCFKNILNFIADKKVKNTDENTSLDQIFMSVDICNKVKNLFYVNKSINKTVSKYYSLLKIKHLLCPYEDYFESLYKINEFGPLGRNKGLVLFENSFTRKINEQEDDGLLIKLTFTKHSAFSEYLYNYVTLEIVFQAKKDIFPSPYLGYSTELISEILSQVNVTEPASKEKQKQFTILKKLYSTTLKDCTLNTSFGGGEGTNRAITSRLPFRMYDENYPLTIKTFKKIMAITG